MSAGSSLRSSSAWRTRWACAPDGTGDGSRAVRGVRALLADLRFPLLRSIGVDGTHLDALADLAHEDVFHTLSPEPWTRAELRGAFAASLAEEAW